MATPIHGRNGRLYVSLASGAVSAEPVTNLSDWAITFNVSDVEVTSFGDTNKTYTAGLPDVGGTFKGFYDSASAQLYTAATDGVARRFYLYPTTAVTTTYWYGTALFDFNAQAAVNGAVDIGGNWKAATAVTKVG